MICFFGTLRLVAATPEIHNLTTSFNITPTFSSSLFAYNVTTEDGYFTFKMDFDEALTCYVYEDDVFVQNCRASQSIKLSSTSALFVLELFFHTDNPHVETNYTFLVTQPPCDVTNFTISQFPDAIHCTETESPDDSAVRSFCIAQSAIASVSFNFTSTESCASPTIQYQFNGSMTDCPNNTCPFVSGENVFELAFVNSVEPSQLTVLNGLHCPSNRYMT